MDKKLRTMLVCGKLLGLAMSIECPGRMTQKQRDGYANSIRELARELIKVVEDEEEEDHTIPCGAAHPPKFSYE